MTWIYIVSTACAKERHSGQSLLDSGREAWAPPLLNGYSHQHSVDFRDFHVKPSKLYWKSLDATQKTDHAGDHHRSMRRVITYVGGDYWKGFLCDGLPPQRLFGMPVSRHCCKVMIRHVSILRQTPNPCLTQTSDQKSWRLGENFGVHLVTKSERHLKKEAINVFHTTGMQSYQPAYSEGIVVIEARWSLRSYSGRWAINKIANI